MNERTGKNGGQTASLQSQQKSQPRSHRPASRPQNAIAVRKNGHRTSRANSEPLAGFMPLGFSSEFSFPESFRSWSEKTVLGTRDAYELVRNSLEEATDALEHSVDAANRGVKELNVKILDMAYNNLSAGFELAKDLARAKTIAEATELQASYFRRQASAVSGQIGEFQAFSADVITETVRPLQTQMLRSSDKLRASN